MAAVSPMSVNAGDVMSAITVTYTADGQVDNGQLKLTIPANWDAPMIKQRYDRRRRLPIPLRGLVVLIRQQN